MSKIDCFIAFAGEQETTETVSALKSNALVNNIFVISSKSVKIPGSKTLKIKHLLSADTIMQISKKSSAPYSLLALQTNRIIPGQLALERMLQVAENTGAAMVYADYLEIKDDTVIPHPVIDYQPGSLRDDFNFGPVQFYRTDILKSYLEKKLKFAGYYALRLHASREGEIIRIPEFLFSMAETGTGKPGEKQSDYVNDSAREEQIEMERVCTAHLQKVGAFLSPPFKEIDFSETQFPVEVSVIISVKNGIKTIRETVESAISQKTVFWFNLIVIDNHSTDGTTEILRQYADEGMLIHHIPERNDLETDGCLNEGIFHEKCGRFVVQLGSNDLYTSDYSLQNIVDKFHKEKCAMVISSYRMTDFNFKQIPPGVVDLKEWTPDNGPNNALRINIPDVPSAFYTPVIRQIKMPNVNYGGNYAAALAISRTYKTGIIYEPVYFCRRDTDESLDIENRNKYNFYKDRIRTTELLTRIKNNA